MLQSLSSYRIFYTVAKTQNISKAAKELYISQPAISKSIQKLEESLGCELFRRSSRGVLLTEEGELLFTHVTKSPNRKAAGPSLHFFWIPAIHPALWSTCGTPRKVSS